MFVAIANWNSTSEGLITQPWGQRRLFQGGIWVEGEPWRRSSVTSRADGVSENGEPARKRTQPVQRPSGERECGLGSGGEAPGTQLCLQPVLSRPGQALSPARPCALSRQLTLLLFGSTVFTGNEGPDGVARWGSNQCDNFIFRKCLQG